MLDSEQVIKDLKVIEKDQIVEYLSQFQEKVEKTKIPNKASNENEGQEVQQEEKKESEVKAKQGEQEEQIIG